MKKLFTLAILITFGTVLGQCVEVFPAGNATFIKYPNGDFWATGQNNGAFGNGTTASSLVFVPLGNDNDWRKIVSKSHNLLIKTNGTLWGWGNNDYGELGNSDTSYKNSPILMSADTDWIDIKTGLNHSLALKSNGTIWSCGRNNFGQLGLGNIVNNPTLTQVGIDTDWAKIETYGNMSFAIKNNGTLWMWGYTYNGQAGNGSVTVFDPALRTTPQQIGNDNDWNEVRANPEAVVALKNNGTLWAWGGNLQGSLGDGTTNSCFFPRQLGSANDWTAIEGLSNFTALKNDGSLWVWGINNFGFAGLGNNNLTFIFTPTHVGSAGNCIRIEKNFWNTAVLHQDGKYYIWGSNQQGQIGNGTTTNVYTPTLLTVACNLDLEKNNKNLSTITTTPNPTDGIVNIDLTNNAVQTASIKIFNSLGQEINVQDKIPFINNKTTIDLTNHSSGIYFLKISTDTQQQTIKIIKQ